MIRTDITSVKMAPAVTSPWGLLGIMLLVTVLSGFSFSGSGEVTLSGLFSDGAVLQRDRTIPVWGTAPAGTTVSVTFVDLQENGVAQSDGRWQIELPPMPAGGPYVLTVRAGEEIFTVTDLYVGDVWLVSGQSNMEFTVSQSIDAASAIATANDPLIRQFRVGKGFSAEPESEIPDSSSWTEATPAFVGNFSAVAYFAATELRRAIDVPVGILNVSHGGTRIESWMSERMLGYDETDVVLGDGSLEVQPTLAFNEMINPVVGFPLRGFLWYQGASNAETVDDARAYGKKFKTLISGWRELWGNPDLPFVWIQLPGFGDGPGNRPSDAGAWPSIREEQSSALALPNTGEAITIDLSDRDLHPADKRPVAHRAALEMRRVGYHEENIPTSPRYYRNTVEVDGDIRVTFENTGKGLVASSDRVGGVAIMDADGSLEWADAYLSGNDLIVSATSVNDPREIRYGWEYNPTNANLYSIEGLPVAPFRAEVNPGFSIAYFNASRTEIEPGEETTLYWKTFNTKEVVLNGLAVAPIDSLVVTPLESAVFELVVVNFDNVFDSLTARLRVDVGGITTDLYEENELADDSGLTLSQNAPNPAHDATMITYQIGQSDHVKLELFDMVGRKLSSIVDAQQAAGEYSVQVDVHGLSSGIYVYRLSTSDATVSRELVVMP